MIEAVLHVPNPMYIPATPALARLAWWYHTNQFVSKPSWPTIPGWTHQGADILPLGTGAGFAIGCLRLAEVVGAARLPLTPNFERGMWGDMPDVYGWELNFGRVSHPTDPVIRGTEDVDRWFTSEEFRTWRTRQVIASAEKCEEMYRWVPGISAEERPAYALSLALWHLDPDLKR